MPKITEMFAFVAIDKDENDEGIMAAIAPDGMMMPLVGADTKRVVSLIPIADDISKSSGKPYKILKFDLVGELHKDEIDRNANNESNT